MQAAVSMLVEECPLCGSQLSGIKLEEIHEKQRVDKERHAKQTKLDVQKLVAEERQRLAGEKEVLERKTKAALAAQEALKQKSQEQSEAIEKLKADKAAAEKRIKETVEEAVTKAEQKKDKDAAKQLEAERTRTRAALKAEHDKEMIKKVAEENRKTEAALKKVKELERKLEGKTANELGDGAEIDIFDELKKEFDPKGDDIERVPKGQPGPDIIHTVINKAETCGKIIFDSKNRQGWQHSYTTKLRADMIAAKADYAILPSIVFPKEKRELCVQDHVLVVNPARVVELVRILRNALIRFHQANKSNEERAEKKAKLYEYINSEQFRQKFEEASKLTGDLEDIDVKEHEAHTKVWDKRHQALKKIKAVLGDLDDDISDIIHSKKNG